MAEDENKVLAESKKWPYADRIAHGSWKVRSAAYEDMRQTLQGVYDPEDPCLQEFGPLFVKAVADSNAAAQDKALEALNAFLEKASEQHVVKNVDKTSSNVVGKCLNGRISTVQRATEALLSYIELEQSSAVVDALIAGFNNKVPKIVVASIEVLVHAFSNFGAKVIVPQPVLKALPPLFESKDGKARDKVKELVVELSRWVGPDLIRSALFKDMRDAMKDDIERAMQEVAGLGRPKAVRFTRREQAKQAAMQAQHASAGPGAGEEQAEGAAEAVPMEEEAPAEVDPYEFAEPRDVLKELKKEFWEGLESKKWSDRKGALSNLKELCSYPRLASGRDMDYGDVNRELRKVITKDSNVACVAEAILCTGAMAKGLRAAFSATAKGLVEVLLEKYKEKNSAVGKAVTESLAIMHKYCFGLLDVAEYVAAALGHANPKVKEETLGWLREEVGGEAKPALVKLAPLLLTPASKCAEEAAPSLREAAMGFMVAFAVKFGNAAVLEKFTTKMDDGKKKRLEEMLAEAQGKPAGGAAPAAAAAPAGRAGAVPPPAASTSPVQAARPGARPSAAAAALAAAKGRPGTSAVRSSISSAPASAAVKPAAGSAAAPKKAGGAGGKDLETEDEATLASGSLSKDEAFARFTDMFGESTVKALQDDQWKARLDAMDAVAAKARDGSLLSSASVLIQGMAHIPGWGEKNFQVMAKQFEVIKCLATDAQTLTRRDGFVAINGLVEKVSDLKLKGPSFDALSALSEALGPGFVATMLHKKAAVHKNPKVLSEVLNWIAQAVEEFGLGSFNVKALLDWAKEDLGSANAGVRNSAIHMLGAMHKFLGAPLGDMLRSDVKPALMAAIEGEFAKCPKDPSIVPVRFSRADAGKRAAGGAAKGADKEGGSSSGAGGGGGGGGFDADDLLPRSDISASITPAIITSMGSSNWKDRKQAMDDVEGLITSAGGRIQPSVGDLFSALKGRMADSNKNLTAQALILLGKVAKAMGKPIDRTARPLLGPALKNLSDNKANVRGAVVEMLDAWVSAAGTESVMGELMEALTSPKCTADGKAEGISWLASLVGSRKVPEHLSDCCKAVALGSGDKSGEVREAAGRLVAALIQQHTLQEIGSAASMLEAGPRKTALEAIQKASGQTVPAAAAPAPSAAPSSVRASSATGVRSSMSKPPTSSTTGAASVRSSIARAPAGGVRSSLSLNKSVNLGSGSLTAAQQQPDNGPLILLDNKKEARAVKGKFRPAKLEIRPDEAATLEAEFSPLLSGHLKGLMFAKDFKRHCEAADAIREALGELYDEVMGVLDLLFRWSTLRIAEANTQVLVKVLDMLKEVLAAMDARGAKLSDFEAKLILPVVVEKAGHNQDKIKQDHRDLIRRCAAVHPPIRVAAFVKDGLESKNNKTRVVCAEELGVLIDAGGPALYRTAPATTKTGAPAESLLMSLAKLVAERDNAIRTAALGSLEIVYAYEGDGIWRLLGKLGDQARTLVEERLKYTDKQWAKQGLRAGYKAMDAMDVDDVPPSSGMGSAGTSRVSTPLGAQAVASPGRRPASPSQPQQPPSRRSSLTSSVQGLSSGGGAAPQPAATGIPRTGIPAGGSSILAGINRSGGGSSPAPASAVSSDGGAGIPTRTSNENMAVPDNSGLARASTDGAGVPTTDQATLAYLRQSSAQPMQNPLGNMSSGGVSPMQGLDKSSEASMQRDFQRCIHQLSSDNVEDVVAVMKLLCYELMDLKTGGAKLVGLFRSNMDQLVCILTNKTDLIFAQAGDEFALNRTPNTRACKYALNVLMNIFQAPVLAQALGERGLRPLMGVLLCCLVDPRLTIMGEGMALLKALNLLMMKILENCDRTFVFCALMELLLAPHHRLGDMDPSQREKLEAGWYDLVVKCMIKITKSLPNTIDSIDLSVLLLAVHKFFDALGSEEIRRRGAREDKPLRMVKTVLHEVCKLKGAEIHQFTKDIPGADLEPSLKPIIFPYIDLNLQTIPGAQQAAAAAAAAARPPIALPSAGSGPAAASPAMPAARSIPQAAAPQAVPSAGQAPSNVLAVNTNALNTATGTGAHGAHANASMSPKIAVQQQQQQAQPQAAAPAAPAQAAAPAAAPVTAAPLQPSADFYRQSAVDDATWRNVLAAIFKRIAEADRQQALVDLFFFSQANPDRDVDGMLSNASPTFKQFIMRGLQKVKAIMVQQQQQAAAQGQVSTLQRMAPGVDVSPDMPSSPGVKRAAPVVGEDKIAELRDRMNRMQSDFKDMPQQRERSSTTASAGAVVVHGGGSSIPSSPSAQAPAEGTSMAALQERMRRLRELEGQ